MSLYLAPTAAAATTTTTTLPRQLLPAPSIDLRRLERRGMALPLPPAPAPPPPLVSANNRHAGAKHKAVVVMGATGTGKSRLAVDLALRFGGEVINSDKIQLHAGLDVTTNKVTEQERAGVPHHLLGVARPDEEFTAADFRREATRAARAITARGRLPIVAGGSNSYVEELVDGDRAAFRDRYDCCFLWVDVQRAVLHGCVARRVDEMRARGLVDEVAAAFDPRRNDYSRGLWRAIGAPELDAYLRWPGPGVDGDAESEGERDRLLAAAIEDIKSNTRRLSCRQRAKIQRLAKMWGVRRVDATEVFRRRGDEADEAWQRLVAAPCIDAVRSFLRTDDAAATVASDLAVDGVVPVFAPAPAAAVAG
ncbi:isopentenyl transferase IPT4 [Zea mays]|jgi:adenylate dimethylallyltransferase (cytokinin synthase)|uniref:adenylate dimethylallyltransferase (ADP/ATP-dependent) n=1 Tax=Zea mays TaxID=4577 RepID=B2XWS5_MAIZE|nr:isopentenyl transferase IPT4 [Zea mays]ABY78883.1 isopentenyl transferase IPT4 [Zea mays]ONM52415.1 isopentenyl transferase4 [Zea mays]|eukprot:NP_001121195.1 isopentenyl transferase IPT4 [Zea mays]